MGGAGPQAGLLGLFHGGSLTVVKAERRVDESGCWVEEDAEVECGQVVGLNAVVFDGHVAVVVGSSVHVPATLSCIQHVREAGLLQPIAVQSCCPGPEGRGWLAAWCLGLDLGGSQGLPLVFCCQCQSKA